MRLVSGCFMAASQFIGSILILLVALNVDALVFALAFLMVFSWWTSKISYWLFGDQRQPDPTIMKAHEKRRQDLDEQHDEIVRQREAFAEVMDDLPHSHRYK